MDTCRHFFGAFERFSKADIFGIRSPPISLSCTGWAYDTRSGGSGKRGSGGGLLAWAIVGGKKNSLSKKRKEERQKDHSPLFYLGP